MKPHCSFPRSLAQLNRSCPAFLAQATQRSLVSFAALDGVNARYGRCLQHICSSIVATACQLTARSLIASADCKLAKISHPVTSAALLQLHVKSMQASIALAWGTHLRNQFKQVLLPTALSQLQLTRLPRRFLVAALTHKAPLRSHMFQATAASSQLLATSLSHLR